MPCYTLQQLTAKKLEQPCRIINVEKQLAQLMASHYIPAMVCRLSEWYDAAFSVHNDKLARCSNYEQ